jgi:hypothetical protein
LRPQFALWGASSSILGLPCNEDAINTAAICHPLYTFDKAAIARVENLLIGNAEFISEHFGIADEQIFNSRDSSFVKGVKRVTNGRGVMSRRPISTNVPKVARQPQDTRRSSPESELRTQSTPIQLAKYLDLTVYVTVGTEDKRRFISEHFGIADEQIWAKLGKSNESIICCGVYHGRSCRFLKVHCVGNLCSGGGRCWTSSDTVGQVP